MLNPAVNGRVIDIDTTLCQHFLKLTITDAVLTGQWNIENGVFTNQAE
ncbi:hypothetical protein [Moellerella wisconsensis]